MEKEVFVNEYIKKENHMNFSRDYRLFTDMFD